MSTVSPSERRQTEAKIGDVQMNWKKLINMGTTPTIGYEYRVDPNSNKQDWNMSDIERLYKHTYKIQSIRDNDSAFIILKANDASREWRVSKKFLAEHFTLIDIP